MGQKWLRQVQISLTQQFHTFNERESCNDFAWKSISSLDPRREIVISWSGARGNTHSIHHNPFLNYMYKDFLFINNLCKIYKCTV
jgi:hypothetical protein